MRNSTLLDLLCDRDRERTREQHYARILCGEIYVAGHCVRDPQTAVGPAVPVEYRPRRRYVSRGGEKLEVVLDRWKIEVRGLSFLDAGASTGGFTDCLLQRGASRVIAVEAGRNQLDYRLRNDSRVQLLEGTNIMDVRVLPGEPQAAVADLSLRSLRRAANHILSLVSERWMIALIKPQYEWHEPPADFDGVVGGTSALPRILLSLLEDLQREGVAVSRLAASHLPGRKGNREFFCYCSLGKPGELVEAETMVSRALEQIY
jgi:23S rRNA (cytidine1920-2'-O)/16S rRNA (cytidine1409-2'-O)-methyltransferase